MPEKNEDAKGHAYSNGFLQLSGSPSPSVLSAAFPAHSTCRCHSKSPAAQLNIGAGRGQGSPTKTWMLLYHLQQQVLCEEWNEMFLAKPSLFHDPFSAREMQL